LDKYDNLQLVKYGWKAVVTRKNGKKDFITKYYDFKPDIFFFWKDQQIPVSFLTKLKNKSPKTKFVMWYGDQRGYVVPDLIAHRQGLIDALLMTNDDPEQVKMYNRFGIPNVFTFYHSFSTDEFQCFPTPISHQIFFGGNNFKYNKFPLSRFRVNFVSIVNKRFKLLVYGGGWAFTQKRWVLRPDYAKVLRRANMNLGINHYDVTRYYNRRLFECVASGRMHITYYIPGMEKHFENRKHLVWFKTVPEGIKLIKYYLKKPEKREEIAKVGRDFFIKHHSWPVRAKQFVKLLGKIC
jgi:hypothetical protein